MIIINKNKNLIGVGCEGCAFILQVNSIDSIKIIRKLKFKEHVIAYAYI